MRTDASLSRALAPVLAAGLLGLVWLPASPAQGDSAPGRTATQATTDHGGAKKEELQRDLDALSVLSRTATLLEFAKRVDEVKGKWRPVDVSSYLEVLNSAVNDVYGHWFAGSTDADQRELVDRYAAEALEYDNVMTLPQRISFVARLDYVPVAPTADWPKVRRQRALLWCSTWAAVWHWDHDFTLTSKDLMLPPLPDRRFIGQRVVVNGWVEPASITDPVAREIYSSALAKYKRNWELANAHDGAPQADRFFAGLATRCLIAAYAAPPLNTDEIRQILTAYVPDRTSRATVMSELNAKLTARVGVGATQAEAGGAPR